MPGLVPLTERMERAFAARAADLPPETQLLLLVAALNDSESLGEVLQPALRSPGDRWMSRCCRRRRMWRSSSSTNGACASGTR